MTTDIPYQPFLSPRPGYRYPVLNEAAALIRNEACSSLEARVKAVWGSLKLAIDKDPSGKMVYEIHRFIDANIPSEFRTVFIGKVIAHYVKGVFCTNFPPLIALGETIEEEGERREVWKWIALGKAAEGVQSSRPIQETAIEILRFRQHYFPEMTANQFNKMLYVEYSRFISHEERMTPLFRVLIAVGRCSENIASAVEILENASEEQVHEWISTRQSLD